MTRNLYVGGNAYISAQERGLPRYGRVAAIDGEDVTLELLGTGDRDAQPESAVFPLSRLEGKVPDTVTITRNPVPYTPMVLGDATVQLTSLLIITPTDRQSWMYTLPLLVVANAVPDFRERAGYTALKGVHPWARDEDGKLAYRFRAELGLLRFDSADESGVTRSALLNEVRFYDPAGDTPWKNAVQADDRLENAGFPFQPPRVLMRELTGPAQIRLEYGTPEQLQESLDWYRNGCRN
ncbi:hypothetical protein [Curtobacterium sp. MCBD17_040]|uniref:hypothetical protein n=1 Tax=Curtobacterium sp. MCBD17_040 TaxID=2175674 RepID=UPI000DA70E10|nr:hypothetical protein [Curtobacterium sp. MCBD17_040]WIB65437.1 hypothetical protein DEI94_18720 [Curtobacterium sp. MCBD17_040]